MSPLLVATNRRMFLIEGNDKKQIGPTLNRMYGITWNSQYIFAKIIREISRWNGKGWDKIYTKKQYTHQIHYDPAINSILLTNTETNSIGILDLKTKKEKKTKWEFATENPHINSIWVNNNKYYVCEHGYREPSVIRIFNRDWQQIDLITIGNGIHNVYVENEILYTLSSRDSTIIKLNLNTKEKEEIKLHNMMPRGLARTKNCWFIGFSSFGKRKDRHKLPGCVIEYDNNFQILNIIDVPGPVHEIRALKEDSAHNGLDCPCSNLL